MYEVICPYCDGEGWVKVVEDDDPDKELYDECETCQGRKFIYV